LFTLEGVSSAWECGLTPRSSGAPTAWRLARAAVLFIIYRAGQAPHRRCPFNSHVRQHREALAVFLWLQEGM